MEKEITEEDWKIILIAMNCIIDKNLPNNPKFINQLKLIQEKIK